MGFGFGRRWGCGLRGGLGKELKLGEGLGWRLGSGLTLALARNGGGAVV